MRKTVYLYLILLLSLDMTAQIEFDNNWVPVINDDFHDFQGWNDYFKENCRYPGYQQTWECYAREYFTGITNGNRPHAYQTSHTCLDAGNKITLKAEHISNTPLVCGVDYFVPLGKQCPDGTAHQFDTVFYFSGMLETVDKYWFGYYEIKRRIPIHVGAKTSFWLYGQGTNYYEEIDIFENTAEFHEISPERGYSCGIHYNPDSSDYNSANHSINLKYQFADSIPNVNQLHTYACEWLPDRVRWFFDDELIFECNDRTEIPQHPMRLKVTHPVTTSAVEEGVPTWQGCDTVIISHIKYYQLEFDCGTDLAIRNVNAITGYQPGVKHSIVMGASGGLEVPQSVDITFRASESITIDNEFSIPMGAQVRMMVQGCPDSE